MEVALLERPEQDQLDELRRLLSPLVVKENDGGRVQLVQGPDIIEDEMIAAEGVYAVAKCVHARLGHVYEDYKGYKISVEVLRIMERYSVYGRSGVQASYSQYHTFNWEGRSILSAHRRIKHGSEAQPVSLEAELDRLDDFNPDAEAIELPALQLYDHARHSFNEVNRQDADQLILDIGSYARRAAKIL